MSRSRLLLAGPVFLLVAVPLSSLLAQQSNVLTANAQGSSLRPLVIEAKQANIYNANDVISASAQGGEPQHNHVTSDDCFTNGACPANAASVCTVGHGMSIGCWWCCNRIRACAQSACTMPPHYAYFPSMHGYYYFRPYHSSHLTQQQALAAEWGEDPRNPYANRLFQQLREEQEAAQPASGPTPATTNSARMVRPWAIPRSRTAVRVAKLRQGQW